MLCKTVIKVEIFIIFILLKICMISPKSSIHYFVEISILNVIRFRRNRQFIISNEWLLLQFQKKKKNKFSWGILKKILMIPKSSNRTFRVTMTVLLHHVDFGARKVFISKWFQLWFREFGSDIRISVMFLEICSGSPFA